MFDLLVNFKIIFSKIHRHFTGLDWLSDFTFLAFQIAQVTPTHVQLYVFFEHLTACEYCHKLVSAVHQQRNEVSLLILS